MGTSTVKASGPEKKNLQLVAANAEDPHYGDIKVFKSFNDPLKQFALIQ
jgi:hypothetical protein